MGKSVRIVLILVVNLWVYTWGIEIGPLNQWEGEVPLLNFSSVWYQEVEISGDPGVGELLDLERYLWDILESGRYAKVFLQAVNNNQHYSVTGKDGKIILTHLGTGTKTDLTRETLGLVPGSSNLIYLFFCEQPGTNELVRNQNTVSTYVGALPPDVPAWLRSVPWYLIQDGVDYVKRTYDDARLGTWEVYLMAAIWKAEGEKLDTAFGIKRYDNPYDKAEECSATIYKYINRFWDHLEKIKNNPLEAEQFGKTLVATAALELYRAGENLFEYLGTNVLQTLVPNYLDFLNRGEEPNVDGAIKRLNYARFLLSFIPEDFDTHFDYKRVARYFLDRFRSASETEQFLMFATFFLPYEGMDYSSGYCPIWDMRGNFWRGAWEEKPGHFELNSNWGMNVYTYLNYFLQKMPPVPVSTPVLSYFLIRKLKFF